MIKYLFSLFTTLLILSCGSSNTSKEENPEELEIVTDLSEVTNEKKQLVSEIISLQKDLEDKRLDKIPEYLDCPKRIEEIELSTENSKIRNAIESNSSRLSTDVIREQYDLIYTEMDLNIINESLKLISKEDLLVKDKVSSTVKIDDCEYETGVLMNELEVKFNIKSMNDSGSCKKDQQWKFKSNGEYLVLDRRYYL